MESIGSRQFSSIDQIHSELYQLSMWLSGFRCDDMEKISIYTFTTYSMTNLQIKEKMGVINYFVWLLSQSEVIARISEYDPALGRLIDRSLWMIITWLLGWSIEYISSTTFADWSLEGVLAMTATAILYLWQTWASKKLRDLERDQ